MRILFLGDIVGPSGCEAIRKNLQNQIEINKINFVVVNGENSADQGVGITEKISKDFLTVELMLSQLVITFGIKKKLLIT